MRTETPVRILADENITQVREYFSPYGDVHTVPGRHINAEQLSGFDALLVRSVTKVTPQLFSKSSCRFVATATSGIDHIDLSGLNAAGVRLAWAKGCNSISVVDYCCSVMAGLSPATPSAWTSLSAGIIGCGLIGSALAERLLALGMTVKIYDPFLPTTHPLAKAFSSLEEALQQAVISLHVPLTVDGAFPTKHMLAAQQLACIPPESMLINAARGAAIDNQELLQWLQQRPAQRVVLDTWEHEPEIALPLLARVSLGTPHIAGYSVQGKLKGTQMILQQFCQNFGFKPPSLASLRTEKAVLAAIVTSDPIQQLNDLVLKAYDVRNDHDAMLGLLSSETPAQDFDLLRKHYPQRHEFSHFVVDFSTLLPSVQKAAAVLGFNPLR
jgi:erythronate-4-phosphate dehydrogenase